MRARSVGGAAAIALLLAVAGCGEKRATTQETVAPTDNSTSASTGSSTAGSDGGSTVPVATFAPNGEVAEVKAIDNNFVQQTLTVVAGTDVKWTNNGRNAHNVVPEGDPQATTWGILDADFEPKDTYSYVFTTPGTYVYYCTIHGTATAGMFGTIVVTAP